MIDWLRAGRQEPRVTIGDRDLPLAIRRHPRAKRLTLRLAPDGSEVRVTMPSWGRTLDALTFARARADWLQQQLASVPAAAPITPDGTTLYRGHRLPIAWSADNPRAPRLAGEAPEATSLQCGGPQAALQQRIARWLEREAMRLFAEDLAHYCARAGLGVPVLKLSRAQRRWGSCSGGGASGRPHERCIRINWRLVMAPDPVRRSVIAHEVAHLSHFDHSPAFHAHLAQLFEDEVKAADRWLREHGRTLYVPFG